MKTPLLTTAHFELRYHLRQPSFYLFAVLILGQGIWYSSQLADVYAYADPTQAVYLIISSLGVMLAVIATLLAGQSLTKDLDYRTTAYLFTLPITPHQHFVGRFLGTYATLLLLAIFYPLGILLFLSFYNLSSPVVWLALCDGFVRLLAQNVFIAVSLTFSLTVFLRSIRGAYISLFLVVLYFLLTESSQNFVVDSDLWQLVDPFGVGMARESVEAMMSEEISSDLLVFSDMFLINRLLWLGLTLGLLTYAERRFSFEYFAEQQPSKAPKTKSLVSSVVPTSHPLSIQLQFDGKGTWQTIGHLIKLEFLHLIRQPIFPITVSFLLLLSVLSLTVLGHHQDFPELPITSRMTALRLPMGLFISLFLLVMTSELVFLDRTVGFWPIHDALPQPNYVFLLAKLMAMVGLAAFLTLVLFGAGVGVQLSNGFSIIDWARYGNDLLMDGFLRYCQLIALGALVAVLVNNRLTSHLINLLLFATLTIGYLIVPNDQALYSYSFLPGSITYSDLIGYGNNASIRPIIHAMWWIIAGLFITAYLLTWNRGVPGSLSERIQQWKTQIRWPFQLAFGVFSALLTLSIWQLNSIKSVSATQPIAYTTRTVTVLSASGKAITVQIKHHHPYQVQHILQSVQLALHDGEQLFGAYPYANLTITETPLGQADVASKPGQILFSEQQGWTADYRKPAQLDHIDYLISREVVKQWLVHTLNPAPQPGDGFIKQSLPEYLALQMVAKQYGTERLRQRLSQRSVLYAKSQQRSHEPMPSLLQSSGNDAVERGKGSLALTSIEQIWGAKPLSLTISQFYHQAIQEPTSATAIAFADELSHQLPDSLKYLRTYLSEPFAFDFEVGRIANLPNGLTVEIISSKWREAPNKQRQPVPINDYVPLVVLDEDGHQLYRQLVHPNSDERFIYLPHLPNARKVVIDPLGAWLEPNKRDNAKLL